jgi:predicted nucleotidyltransferase
VLDADGAVRLAEAVLRARYPEAAAAFVAGSIVRGAATALSDIDLVVLFDHLPTARREAFTFEGERIDAFLHDGETLAWVLNADVEAGRPAHLTMVCEGRIVGPRPEAARAWGRRAAAMLRAGPPPFDAETLARFRMLITDRIDDLRDRRGRAVMVATGAWLYPALADLILRGRGEWAATAKWIPPRLRAVDPALEAAFSEAFEALFARNDPAPLIAFAEEALAPFGGFLFDGYESRSPASARRGPA